MTVFEKQFILLSALFGTQILLAQEHDQTNQNVSKMRMVVESLKDVSERLNAIASIDARPSIKKVSDSVAVLGSKLDPSATPEYLATIDLDRAAIEKFISADNTSESHRLLNAAAADLEIKAKHARNASGITVTAGSRVKVSVISRRDGHDVNGYLVRANPMTAANENPPRFIFNNPTSPSKSVMPPGEYWMWLEKDGQAIGRRGVAIGGDGETEQDPIFFDVP